MIKSQEKANERIPRSWKNLHNNVHGKEKNKIGNAVTLVKNSQAMKKSITAGFHFPKVIPESRRRIYALSRMLMWL